MEETPCLNNNDAEAEVSRLLTRNTTVVDLDKARAQIKEAEETKRLLKQFAEIRNLCAGEITSTRYFTCTSFIGKVRKLFTGEITSTSFFTSFVENPDGDEVRRFVRVSFHCEIPGGQWHDSREN